MTYNRNVCARCERPIDQPKTGRPRVYCSPTCRTAAYDHRRLVIEATLAQLHEECGGVCYLCSEPIDLHGEGGDRPSFDHVLATARGGGHARSNIRLTHLRCNVAKSARLVCPHCGTPA